MPVVGVNGSNGQRDNAGRFKPGNQLARRRGINRDAIGRAFAAAISDADLQALARTLVAKGKAGNVTAAREVLDRTCGRARVADREAAPLLKFGGELHTLAGVSQGLADVLDAVAAGRISLDEGGALTSMLDQLRAALEGRLLERRVQDLEEQLPAPTRSY